MALTKEYLLALQSLPGIGPKTLLKIGDYIKDNGIDSMSTTKLASVLENLNVKVKKEFVTVEQLDEAMSVAAYKISQNERYGIGITTYYDSDFPEMLRSTVNEEGKSDPPVVLYYKGDLSITKLPGLAVIGTREVTDFGEKAGSFLTEYFSRKGLCIVSGLAIGCDTVGHKAALSAGGKTIAFLAHGLDTIYPPENKELSEKIVENGGLLLSEYPLGISVNRYNLVARDRLQAAMSKATLVIQTGIHGGTMHAANTTLVSMKPLYVVKFQKKEQNEHEMSLGNEYLVKKGAKFISGGDDLEAICESIISYQKPKTSLFE